jgi:hypothetical protein
LLGRCVPDKPTTVTNVLPPAIRRWPGGRAETSRNFLPDFENGTIVGLSSFSAGDFHAIGVVKAASAGGEQGEEASKKWGPYLNERQWVTTREDYTGSGDAWNYFTNVRAKAAQARWQARTCHLT